MGIIARITKLIHKDKPLPIGKFRVFGVNSVIESDIDDYSYISPNTLITHTRIGKFCSIATNCVIGESDHPYRFLSSSPIFYHKGNIFGETWTDKDHFQIYETTVIGNDVWIGAGVFIKSGVKISDGAVIAAGAVVINDVGPFEIVGGVPAKFIKKRFSDELINLILEKQWWNWDVEKLKNNQQSFVTDDEEQIRKFLLNHE